MFLIRGLLDRLILIVGVIAGGCVPSFVTQYHQRVGGRLEQVKEDLAPFRAIADRYHEGSMDALVRHHLKSSDPTFHAEGEAIQAMLDSEARLQHMMQALNSDIVQQLGYLMFHRDPEIMGSTLEAFRPAFTFSTEGLFVAAAFGLFLWLFFLLVWKLISLLAPKKPAVAR